MDGARSLHQNFLNPRIFFGLGAVLLTTELYYSTGLSAWGKEDPH